jgi:membrane protein YqaA with SNARE-associated domain
MAAKSVIYYAGRGVLSLPLGRYQARLQAAAQKLHRSSLGPGGFVFLSSTTGIPPFTVVSILAGTMRIPIAVFLLPGLAGRLVRFGILVLFPQAAREIFR